MITEIIVGVKDELARERKVVTKWTKGHNKSSKKLQPIDTLPKDEMIDSDLLQGRLKELKKQLKKIKRSNSEPDFDKLDGCALAGAVDSDHSKVKKRRGVWNPLHVRHHSKNDGNEEPSHTLKNRSNKIFEKLGRRIPHRPCDSTASKEGSLKSNSEKMLNRRNLLSKSASVKNMKGSSLADLQSTEKLWSSQLLNPKDLEDIDNSNRAKRDRHSRTSGPPVIIRPKRNTSRAIPTLESLDDESDDDISEPSYDFMENNDKDLAEVSPGIFVEFRTEEESWDAVLCGKYSETRCFTCRIPLVSVLDAHYVRCRKCCNYTPFVCMSLDAEPHGVGVGLTKEECGDLLKDVDVPKKTTKKKKSKVR